MTVTRAQRFAQANDLWFENGATGRALALYRELADDDPRDPVARYQLSRALWALGAFEEARAHAEAAHAHRERLSDAGRETLDGWRARIAAPPAPWRYSGIGPELLDSDVLERKDASPGEWQAVGLAAAERDLHGLAAEALGRGITWPDHEQMREVEHERLDAGLERHLLERMVDPR